MNAFNRLRSPKNCFNYFISYHVDNKDKNTMVKMMRAMGVYNYPPNPVARSRGAQTYRILKFVVGSS
jgi:hypothetical protein